ncbi:MAG: penicillin-binding protein 2 [Candidatus Eisenbacteria bacterium]|nr:penicillin-binding protein 2 [Candidatus Eisenbacteria bacterium]
MGSPLSSHGDRTPRALVLGVLLVGLVGVAWLRLAQLQLGQFGQFRAMAENNSIRLKVVPAPRGEIFDCKGRLLADSHALFAVSVDVHRPAFARRPALLRLTLLRLAPLLNLADSTLQRIALTQSRGSMRPVRVAADLDLATLARIEEHRDELPGVEIETLPVRHYPCDTLAAHVLGYSSEITERELAATGDAYLPGDLYGQAGLENMYESWLRGRDGESLVEVNALGRVVGEMKDRPARAPERGKSLWLTLDLDLQRAAEEALSRWPRGAVVALDPRTGAILAMASRPAFDPNEFAHGVTARRWREIAEGAAFPLLNRAMQSAYPPGSTFKLVTASAGLRERLITPESRFQSCGGAFSLGNAVFHCWQHKGHGSLGLHDAIERSCDVYFYQVGLRLGVERLMRQAQELGLGVKTGVDLPSEQKGLVPTESWYLKRARAHGSNRRPGKGVAVNLSIGQGELLLTPLQIAMLAAQVGTGGRRARPYLVETVRDMDGRVWMRHHAETRDGVLGLDAAGVQQLRDAMEAAVENPSGTGGRARVPGVRVAGKTGTAQNPHGEDHAVFMAYAPADAPRIAIGVVIENGGHGASAAAPVAQRILAAMFAPQTLLPREGAARDSSGTARPAPAAAAVEDTSASD